jgi:hypothetical protein
MIDTFAIFVPRGWTERIRRWAHKLPRDARDQPEMIWRTTHAQVIIACRCHLLFAGGKLILSYNDVDPDSVHWIVALAEEFLQRIPLKRYGWTKAGYVTWGPEERARNLVPYEHDPKLQATCRAAAAAYFPDWPVPAEEANA